jgi:hypothetical protein
VATSSARSDWAWDFPDREDDAPQEHGRTALSLAVDEPELGYSDIDLELPGWAPEGYAYVWPDAPAPSVMATIAKLVLAFAGATAVAGLGLVLASKLLLTLVEALFPNMV